VSGAALTGFATSLSLILAIGAQNAFVLRQGLMRSHVFALCLFCAASDAVLIAAGVAGFGRMSAAAPWLPVAMTLGGAAFLVAYGALRLRAAIRGGHALAAAGRGGSVWAVLASAWSLRSTAASARRRTPCGRGSPSSCRVPAAPGRSGHAPAGSRATRPEARR